MFDVFRRRDKAVRIVLGAMMLLIAASMVTYLIPGGFSNQSGQDTVIAEIGKQPLTVTDFQQRMEVAQRNKAIPPGAGPMFAQQMLDQMIAAEALQYEAQQRLGIVITDADLVASLRARSPQLFPNGQFVGKDVYASYLAQQNLTIPEYEADVRRELVLNRITSLIIDNVVVTPEEVVRDYQHKQQRVKLDYVEVVPAKVSSQVSVTPDEMKTYFNAFQGQYRIPERRNFQMLVIDAAQISQRVNLTDDQLRHYYDQNKDQFRTPERVHVRHILLKTTDKAPAQVSGVEAKAQDLLKNQYAPAGAAAKAGLQQAVAALKLTADRLPETAPLVDRYEQRAGMAAAYVEAYRRYCWPVKSLLDLKLAPFHCAVVWQVSHVVGNPAVT